MSAQAATTRVNDNIVHSLAVVWAGVIVFVCDLGDSANRYRVASRQRRLIKREQRDMANLSTVALRDIGLRRVDVMIATRNT